LRQLTDRRIYHTWTFPSGFTIEKLADYFKKEQEKATNAYIVIESRLKQEGLLPALEKTGIIPQRVENPYDPETDREQYEQWWSEHSDHIQRAEKIAHLQIGILLDLVLKKLYLSKGAV
jgi:hypothetical protein